MKPNTGASKVAVTVRAMLATAVLAGTATLLGACSGNTSGTSETGTAPAPAPSSASASSTPKATTASTPEAPTVPGGKVISTSHGKYLQSTILDSDPAMKVQASTLAAGVRDVYSDADIAAAQKFVLKFLVEEGIDSPLNGAGQTPEQWWSEHKNLVAPSQQVALHDELPSKDMNMVIKGWENKKGEATYTLIYDPNKPRVTSRTIVPISVFLVGDNALAFKFNVNYTMANVKSGVQTGPGTEVRDGTMTYSVEKDPATAKWLINGYQHEMRANQR